MTADELRALVVRAASAAKYVKTTSSGDGDAAREECIFTGKLSGRRVRSGTSDLRRIGTDQYGKNGGPWHMWSESESATEPGNGAASHFFAIAGSLRDLGDAVVDGKNVRVYRATATLDQALRASGDAAQGRVLTKLDVSGYVTDWYIGSGDLPVRSISVVKGKSSISGRRTTRYFDWGKPFRIERPKTS